MSYNHIVLTTYIHHLTRTYTPYFPLRAALYATALTIACVNRATAAAMRAPLQIMQIIIDRILGRYSLDTELIVELYGDGYRGREQAAFAWGSALCGMPSLLPGPLNKIYYKRTYCDCYPEICHRQHKPVRND
jgi:hypothetical protein